MTSGDFAAQDCKLNAMTDMIQSFASIVESTSRLGSDAPEDDTLQAVAALYQSRANSAPTCIPAWRPNRHMITMIERLPAILAVECSTMVERICWIL